jgi:hypothetical protein
MTTGMRRWAAVLVVTIGALLPEAARAGSLLGWFEPKDCPPSDYTSLHYWAPTAWRVHAHFHVPGVPMEAELRYPEVPSPIEVRHFHCPATPPFSMSYIEPRIPR